MTIKGAEHPLKDIFSDEFLFEIPGYQRPYRWTTEQAGELFEDLWDATKRSAAEADPDPYFLGSIVLATEEGAAAKVIDGQQRLTTLTVLLAALASFNDEDAALLRVFIRQEANKYSKTDAVMRLRLRPRDEDMFRELVQEPPNLDALLAKDSAQLDNDAQRCIQANARLFVEKLAELTPDERAALATFVVSSCFLVTVSTPDRDSAYRIFAVLNDRGLDLSHADILKSEIIGDLPKTLEDEYTQRWEDAEVALGTEAFKDLFAHLRMIVSKEKQRETLLKEIKTHVVQRPGFSPKDFVDSTLVPYAEVLGWILDEAWESTSGAEEINAMLGWLNRMDNIDWIPPTILYLDRFRNDSPKVAYFLVRLERLAATMFVRRAGINARIERYARLLAEIETHGDVLAEESALDLAPGERSATIERLDGPIYGDRPCRYVLERIEASMTAGGVIFDHKTVSIEHVLPQTPAAGGDWDEHFGELERDLWTNRLANLVLLPRRKNSAAQNYEFDVKKDKYFSGPDGSSPFLLTMKVLQTPVWTPTVLEARQPELVDTLRTIWGL